jgi:hypothetical protein
MCDSGNDCILDNFNRSSKIRKVDEKSEEGFNYRVGGTKLCVDYAKRAVTKAHATTEDCDRASRKCKYSNNYPSARVAHTKHSSIYV